MTQAELNQLALDRFTTLSTRLRREANKYLWWGKLKGNIKVDGTFGNNDFNMTFSEMPIEKSEYYVDGFGNTMIIPTKREYAGNPKYGDSVMKGHEEESGFTWTQIYFNQIRHAITIRKGRQQEIQQRALMAAEQEMPALARYFAKIENWMPTIALLEGVSENLSASTDDDGLGIAKRYHPNFYYCAGIAGTGTITKVTTTAGAFTTLANLDTAAGVITSAAATPYVLDTATLEALREKCMNLNIAPIVSKSGSQFWVMIIHPKQAFYLRKDAAWLAAQREAIVGRELAENAIFNGSIGMYAGFVLFEDPIIVRGWDVANDNFLGLNAAGVNEDNYSQDNKYNRRFLPQITASYNRCAMVLGKSALGYVEAEGLGYRTDDDDYQNIKGLAGVVNYGYSRLDQVSQAQLNYLAAAPASVTTATNDGSLILMSHASIT
jgi:hypothetical protein